MINHSSALKATLFVHLRTKGFETSVAALATCDDTHFPQVQLDRVLFCECDHRADELIGLKVDV